MNEPTLHFNLPSPLEQLDMDLGMNLWMKRDDLIHPIISGNKWRKLKGFFQDVDRTKTIVTFGGAYSNHIPAAALAAKLHGMNIIGVVRGEELHAGSNDRLRYAAAQGMQLEFITRSAFRAFRENDWVIPANAFALDPEQTVLLPEGGAGDHAIEGCMEIWEEISNTMIPDHLIISSGTGTTVYGILHAMPVHSETTVHVISAVRGAKNEMRKNSSYAKSKGIALEWVDEAFGGFGKTSAELIHSKEDFLRQTEIALDLNYNAKLWHWLKQQSLDGTVVWLNTGGF